MPDIENLQVVIHHLVRSEFYLNYKVTWGDAENLRAPADKNSDTIQLSGPNHIFDTLHRYYSNFVNLIAFDSIYIHIY